MTELEYTEKGWRKVLDSNRHHRELRWNYRGEGIYHFTLVVMDHFPLFGSLEGDSAEEANIQLNEFGQQVWKMLSGLPQFYAPKGYALKIIAAQIMPDHIHVIIQVLEKLPQSIGHVIKGFKAGCTILYKQICDTGDKNVTEMKNIFHFARIFASSGSIWNPDVSYYHERILHHYDQLQPMIDYVHDNPRRLWLKRANPDLFRIKQDKRIAGTPCLVLGNIFLADIPLKALLQCSRRMTQAEIETRKAECLREAENGTVFVSGAISEGEKQICRALRQAGFPLIILLTEGFPAPDSPHYKYYKPQGVYFEACAAGKLLLVQPDASVLERPDIIERAEAKIGAIPHDSRRYRFVAMNLIAEDIAKLSNIG